MIQLTKKMEQQEMLVRSMNKKLVLVPDEGLKDGDYAIDISFENQTRYWLVVR